MLLIDIQVISTHLLCNKQSYNEYHLHTSLSIRVYICMMNSQEENFRPKCMIDFCPTALLRGCSSLQSHHENLMKVINSPQTKYIFYIYTCTHTYICIQQCIYEYTYVYMCLCVCIRIYTHTHICTYTYTHIRAVDALVGPPKVKDLKCGSGHSFPWNFTLILFLKQGLQAVGEPSYISYHASLKFKSIAINQLNVPKRHKMNKIFLNTYGMCPDIHRNQSLSKILRPSLKVS